MSGIKLSPKYGVNPCIPMCFFCGNEKNEVALLGKLGGRNEDLEAPRKAVLDYTPCEECQKKFAEGVLLVEVTNSPTYIGFPIAENAYPTGRYIVVKPEALNGNYKAGDKVLIHRKDFIAVFGNLE